MGGQAVGRLFLSLCAFALVCVALSGAPRLIGGEMDAQSPAPFAAAQACLTAPAPDGAQESAPRSDMRARSGEETAQVAHLSASPAPQLRRDANGNVLAAGTSYLRAVYWAFALGDGFV